MSVSLVQNENFIAALESIVGNAQVLTEPRATRRYRTGYRCGAGPALAVVCPGSLREQWQVLQACVAANKVIIVQAANTGLTGGSTPSGPDYDRDVVIVNTRRIAKLYLLDAGRQVICLAGCTLYQLEEALEPLGREPHSVIGSSCIGASVIGGICNNSGGALVRRGPAYTQLALFAQLGRDGQLRLVNHLGVRLGEDPEMMLERLERGEFDAGDIDHLSERWGSDHDYQRRVREIDSDRPARFNADAERLFESSGCAGKLMVFAVRVDTFAKDERTRVFYIGTRDPAELALLRRHILGRFAHLPVAAEYIHRDMFDVAARYGKDAFLSIRLLGATRLPALFELKRRFDALASLFGLRGACSDRLLQLLSTLFPDHLPQRMRSWQDRYEHHLILKLASDGIEEGAAHLRTIFPSTTGDFFECDETEAEKAFLHRFVAAGAAVRYRALHARKVEDIVALDLALRRNDRDWFEVLPQDLRARIELALYYGHFLCHVFHHDYIVRKGNDPVALEHSLCALLDQRGAEYPAEHNVGHLYRAKPALAEFYRSLDPCNHFNPGIGQTSKLVHWRAAPDRGHE